MSQETEEIESYEELSHKELKAELKVRDLKFKKDSDSKKALIKILEKDDEEEAKAVAEAEKNEDKKENDETGEESEEGEEGDGDEDEVEQESEDEEEGDGEEEGGSDDEGDVKTKPVKEDDDYVKVRRGDYLNENVLEGDLLNDRHPAPAGSKSAIMRAKLEKQPLVRVLIPRENKEPRGATFPVTLNGYRLNMKKGIYVEVPKQVADVIQTHFNQTEEAFAEAEASSRVSDEALA